MSKSANRALTTALLIMIAFLIFLNLNKYESRGFETQDNILLDQGSNTIELSSLSLRQKIGQMIIGYDTNENRESLKKIGIGGVYLDGRSTKEEFKQAISTLQSGQIIPLFIAVDLEGCINPFEKFVEFPSFKDIESTEEAYILGLMHAKILDELGIGMNFAPVVDLNDSIWKCRSFPGDAREISDKSAYYIKALQNNGIIATAKHYPGKTLSIVDPHKQLLFASIEPEDLLPFDESISNNVSGMMVSHTIVSGMLDSENRPAVVSRKIIDGLRNKYDGLIITDEVNMQGLKKYYKQTDDMYLDLFKADNDIILNFKPDTTEIEHMISVIEDAVNNGEISESRIDRSVIRILRAKGLTVKI